VLNREVFIVELKMYIESWQKRAKTLPKRAKTLPKRGKTLGFWSFFRGKRAKKPKNGSEMAESDPDLKNLERSIRKTRAEIYRRRLEEIQAKQEEILLEEEIQRAEAQLNDFEDDEDDDDGVNPADAVMNPDRLLMGLLNKILSKPSLTPPSVAAAVPPSPPAQTAKISYTDDQIRQFKKQIPTSYQKQIFKMPDDEIVSALLDRFPDLDNDTIKRAVPILKEV
jgi:hypothetical protein